MVFICLSSKTFSLMARSQSSLKRNSKVDFFLKSFSPPLVLGRPGSYVGSSRPSGTHAGPASSVCTVPLWPRHAASAAALCWAVVEGEGGIEWGCSHARGAAGGILPRTCPVQSACTTLKPCVQKHGTAAVLLHHPLLLAPQEMRFRSARSNVCLRAQQSPNLNISHNWLFGFHLQQL